MTAPSTTSSSSVSTVERERDLYLRLLNLGSHSELKPFLEEALALLTEVTEAHQGWVQIGADESGDVAGGWSTAHGFSEAQLHRVRSHVSSGIIASTLASGETVLTSSAMTDERFGVRESVERMKIEAVLCAPIGDPALGVIYLQRKFEPGGFSDEARAMVETIARHVSPFAARLVARERESLAGDPTQAFRAKLRAESLLGRSRALADLLREMCLVAPLDVDVMLTGPTGSGKTQVARLIHDSGPRAGKPFVELNCNVVPESLVESELFGSMAGAHSTAARRIPGKVEAASGGTLFLDEVGDLPLVAQGKLLQLLQSRTYYPLGETTAQHADVRILAATNIDLEDAVARGSFREDLYYRLGVLKIRSPALSERAEDIPILAEQFAADTCRRNGLPLVRLSPELTRALTTAEWPGNVRQLAHAVQAAAIRAAGAGAAQIEKSLVFPEEGDATGAGSSEAPTFQAATRQFQAELLRRTLAETGWNIVEASRRLDLTRSHVYTLIRSFGLKRPG